MEFLFFGLLEGVHIFLVALQLALEVKVLSTLVAHNRLLLKENRMLGKRLSNPAVIFSLEKKLEKVQKRPNTWF